ncbi:MAG: arylesterase [Thiobacillaceae bacterium]|nr:arylesterase [Thiobacillaceae bacterium]MDW8324805.1 arylesterase [Burkholderiales bacterium]
MRAIVVALLVWLMALPALAAERVILVLGDSLSAAYGLPEQAGWVALLQARLRAERLPYRVVNASMSGETSAGGAARIDALMRTHRPAVVIVALGGNDGLRGLPVAQLRTNLGRILRSIRAGGARAVLVGMRMPPNLGPDYTAAFAAVYAELARTHRVARVPFLLEGFADRPEYFQPDGIHPTAAAQPLMLEQVWRVLTPLLQRSANSSTRPLIGEKP